MRASPGEALIEFRCVRSEHNQRSIRLTLTIHQGKWAFCAHEGETSEHRWAPTGGVQLRDLMQGRAGARRP